MLIVQKFGGSSVADARRIENVARRVAQTRQAGNKVVVVLSAQGDTTDELIQKAWEINPEPSKRELDMLLSAGEQISVSLMAMSVQRLGLPVVSLTGWQAGISTSSHYGDARIRRIDTDRILSELDMNNVVIVAGFQGQNPARNITTLGRGGSDTTAVALAAALNADLCEIYTDVDGVYSADPRIVKTARKLQAISYDEMLELATLGAQVLQNRSVELAKKYNVKLVVRSSLTNAEGTEVREEKKVEKTLVSGIAVDKNIARISVIGVKDAPGTAFSIFSLLARKKIPVDLILQSIGRQNTKDITFTVAKAALDGAIKTLSDNQDLIGYDHLNHTDKVGKLSVVGSGMATNPGVASTLFEALYDADVNIQLISTSEIKISVLINENELEKAAAYVHERLLELEA